MLSTHISMQSRASTKPIEKSTCLAIDMVPPNKMSYAVPTQWNDTNRHKRISARASITRDTDPTILKLNSFPHLYINVPELG